MEELMEIVLVNLKELDLIKDKNLLARDVTVDILQLAMDELHEGPLEIREGEEW
jgi:hypothetical protein